MNAVPSDKVRQDELTATGEDEPEPSDKVTSIDQLQAATAEVPSDETRSGEQTATISQAEDESEPSDKVKMSEEQTATVTGGEEKDTVTTTSEPLEVEPKEGEESMSEKQPLSAQGDTIAVDLQETGDKDFDQADSSTTVGQQEHLDEREEEREKESAFVEEERESADSAIVGSMAESEPEATATTEETVTPPQAKYDSEQSEQTKEDNDNDKMEIEATQESEREAHPSLFLETKSTPSPPPSEESSHIPTIVVSMESSTGDGAVGDSGDVVEPATSQTGEHDTPVVEREQKEEGTNNQLPEVDSTHTNSRTATGGHCRGICSRDRTSRSRAK